MVGYRWIWQTNGWMDAYHPDGVAIMRARDIERIEMSSMKMLTGENLEALVAQAMEKEIEASSAIEGIRLDSSRIRSSIVNNLGIPTMAWLPDWNRNSREEKAVSASLELLKSNEPLSVPLLERIHGKLDNRPDFGHLRETGEIVTNGQRTIYECPSASEARKLTDEFCRWWNNGREKLPSPLAAAVAHLNFVVIHPFADGNGRMARMLADKCLSIGLSPLRPYSLAGAIRKYPGPYYNSLENVTGKGADPKEFVNYILDIHEEEVRRFQARAMLVSRINLISGLSMLERELLLEMSKTPRTRFGKYDAGGNLDVSPGEIEKAWNNLEKRGLVLDGMLDLSQKNKDEPIETAVEEECEKSGMISNCFNLS